MRKKAVLLFTLIFVVTSIATVFAQTAPVADSWVTKAPMHQARSGLGVIAVGDKIYAIGGTLSGGDFIRDVVGTNEEYDITNDTWVNKAVMPTSRAFFAIATYQNKIYCFGGTTGMELVDERSGFYTFVSSNTVEVYDTAIDNWTIKSPMPKGGGMYMSAQEINGTIYVLDSPYVFVYNPVNDTWAERDNLPMPRYSAVIDNKIVATYAHESWTPGPHFGDVIQQVMIYDPQSNNITEGTDDPIAIDMSGVGATVGVFAPPRVYVLGRSVNQVYDPKTDNWTTATAMPTERIDLGVAVVNDTLFAIGGYIRSDRSTTNVNEQYIPVGYGNILPSPTINPSASSSSEVLQPTSPELPIITTIIVVVLVISILSFLRWRKNTPLKKQTSKVGCSD